MVVPLVRIAPQSVQVVERWAIFLERSENDQYQFLDPKPQIEVETTLAFDNDDAASLKGASDLRGLAPGSAARLGVFGLYLPESSTADGGAIDSCLANEGRAPLFAAPGYRWRTWAWDLPLDGWGPPDARSDGQSYPVARQRDVIALKHRGVFPVDLKADVIANDFNRAPGTDRAGNGEDVARGEKDPGRAFDRKIAALSVAQQSSFDLELRFSVKIPGPPAPASGLKATIRRIRLGWPVVTDGSDLNLRVDGQIFAVGYLPAEQAIEFGDISTVVPPGLNDGKFPNIRLRISGPEILQQMPEIEGEADIEVEGTLSGLQPFFADWRGHVWGFAAGDPRVRASSRITVKLKLSLSDLFHRRPRATHHRIQLSGVDIDDQRLDYIMAILREERFDGEPISVPTPSANSRRFSIDATRRQGGQELSVSIYIQTETREVIREIESHRELVKRADRGADTTIDIRGALRGDCAQLSQAVNALHRRLRERLSGFAARR
jgi:hypothetical protein